MNANTFSLLNSAWCLSDSYAQGMLPMLFNILEQGTFEKVEKIDFFSVFNLEQASHTVGGSSATDSPYVAIIDIKHPIFKYDQNCGPVGTRTLKNRLENIKNDPNLKGVVFDIDSGGGQAIGTPEFHEYLLSYPKPTVTYTDGTLASAAYYIASATKYIIAEKNTMDIGSTGTMMNKVDLTGKMAKEGVVIEQVYATKSTKKNAISRITDKEEQKKAVVVKYLDPLNEIFLNHIIEARDITNEDVLEGDIFGAKKALENGLIDGIGTLQTAIDKVIELSDTNPPKPNKKEMKQKELPLVQAALGLTAALGANENGTYLNETQLSALETKLADSNSLIQTLKNDHAVDMDALKANLTKIEGDFSAEKEAKEALFQKLGLEATATQNDALSKIADLNAAPGAAHGNPPSDPAAVQNESVDYNSSIYNL